MPESEITEVRVFAPATVANLGCGYDVLGLAIHGPGDEIILRRSRSNGLTIKAITGDDGKLPIEPEKNTASIAAIAVLDQLGLSGGFELEIHKKMPFGSGLGSSAASAVGGAYAMNELLGSPLERSELLNAAMQGESYASKDWHADNVSPGMLGGICLVRDNATLDVINLPAPEDLWIVVIYDPNIEILTSQARDLIPEHVKTSVATHQGGNLSAFVSALYEKDYALLARCASDSIAEPVRKNLIPKYEHYRTLAMDAGALSFGISGSGPSLFALCHGELSAYKVSKTFEQTDTIIYKSIINTSGVTVC